MCSKDLLLLACLGLLGGLRLTSTTTTTTLVAAMTMANQDLERYLRTANVSQTLTALNEDRIAMDYYAYAFISYSFIDENGQTNTTAFPEEQARYGEGKEFDVLGKLVHITDAEDPRDDTACSPNIKGTNGNEFPPEGVIWIALVRRGRCTFEEKVRNVYAKRALGVIIYNDKPVMNLEKMQIKGQSRHITAVITYQNIGLDMARIVDQDIELNASIKKGKSGSRPINSLNRTSVLFVSISFIVLMVISLVWLIFYYIQRFRYLQTKDQQSRHLCSVTKKAIMKIPTKTGKSTDEKDADSDCCAICIEAYKASDCIRVLPCKHEFHKNCIDPWLIEHRTCPMCKLDVLKFYGFVVGDQINSWTNPQNVAPADDNDVPVIVVAVAPPPATAAAAAAATAGAASATATPTNTTSMAAQTQTQTLNTNQNLNQNASSDSRSNNNRNNNNNSSSSNSSSSFHCRHNSSSDSSSSYNNRNNSCMPNPTIDNGNFSTSTNNASSSNTRSTQTRAEGAGMGSRRNSAPLVLQVSTASRQVTDV